ncbi:MAG: hypothetical protein K9N22_03225 [Candidatus Marinimicrobia bacterium]|nr:hypothetical protein [Candidatus Neomarinimicrobiota bacterium]
MRPLTYTLFKIFIHDRRYDINLIAEQMGISTSLIYKWCEGKSTPTIEKYRQLILITGDRDLLHDFLEGTGFIPARRLNGSHPTSKDIQVELLENHSSLTTIHTALKNALADGEISRKESGRLVELAEQNYREAADVLQVIKSATERPIYTGITKETAK